MSQTTLTPSKTRGECVLPMRQVSDGQFLQPGDPAVYGITDFTREYPITVDEERQIDTALEDMIRFGVRALLVVNDHRVIGLITSYDIQGERPLQFLQNSNYSRHLDVRVGHIMTPWAELLTVPWEALENATAGELLRTLHQAGLSHVLIVEKGAGQAPILRGMASRARLERQLRRVAVQPIPLSAQPGDGGDAEHRRQQGAAQMHRNPGHGP